MFLGTSQLLSSSCTLKMQYSRVNIVKTQCRNKNSPRRMERPLQLMRAADSEYGRTTPILRFILHTFLAASECFIMISQFKVKFSFLLQHIARKTKHGSLLQAVNKSSAHHRSLSFCHSSFPEREMRCKVYSPRSMSRDDVKCQSHDIFSRRFQQSHELFKGNEFCLSRKITNLSSNDLRIFPSSAQFIRQERWNVQSGRPDGEGSLDAPDSCSRKRHACPLEKGPIFRKKLISCQGKLA